MNNTEKQKWSRLREQQDRVRGTLGLHQEIEFPGNGNKVGGSFCKKSTAGLRKA